MSTLRGHEGTYKCRANMVKTCILRVAVVALKNVCIDVKDAVQSLLFRLRVLG